MPATTGRMIPNCPNCACFANESKSHPSAFTLGDGVVHTAPDMWLAGRSMRLEREGHRGLESHRLALHEWAAGCAIAIEFERQHTTQEN